MSLGIAVAVPTTCESGTPKLAIADCTADYNGNSLLAGSPQSSASFSKMTFTLQEFRRLDSSSFPFNPGDALLDAAYQAFLDTEFTVTITDNREMTFPGEFTYTDDQGSSRGTMKFTIKARKLSSDVSDDLGQFLVNSIDQRSHCFSYINQFNANDSTGTVQGTTATIVNKHMYQLFKVQSWPSSPDGISSFLYQHTGEQSSEVNGAPTSTTVPSSQAVSLTNTGGKFANVNVISSVSPSVVDLTVQFDVTSGLTVDYSVSDGASTHIGRVEAVY